MQRKKISLFKKVLLYSALTILGFIAGTQTSAYVNHKKQQNTTNMAYCLTLQDYMTKVANKNIETFDGRSALYIMGGLLNSKKEILKKTCPDIYYNALNLYQKESEKDFK